MKIYSKRLKGLSDLKAEQETLKYAQKTGGLDDIFSLNSITGKKTTPQNNTGSKSTGNNSVLDKLGIAELVLDLVLKYARPKQRRETVIKTETAPQKPQKNLVKSALTEFVGGYIKWKVIELSLKGLSRIIRPRKQ